MRCGVTAAMVTMNHLSVKDPDDESPLLPEAVEAEAPTPVFHRQAITKSDSRDFFLSRYVSRCRMLCVFIQQSCSIMLLLL